MITLGLANHRKLFIAAWKLHALHEFAAQITVEIRFPRTKRRSVGSGALHFRAFLDARPEINSKIEVYVQQGDDLHSYVLSC